MKAGEIEITVAANYAELDSQMKQVVATATAGGGDAGDGFGDKFQASLKRHLETSANQMRMQLIKAAGAIAIGNALKAGLQAGAEGADFTESLTRAVKSVPLVSTVYDIFEAVGQIITGEARKNAEILETEAEAAAIRARTKFKMLQQEQVAGREEDIARLTIQGAVEQAQREANARKVAQAKTRLELHDLEMRKQKDLANAKSEQEKELIRERTVLEFGMIEKRLAEEYRQIDAAEAEKQAKAKEAADKAAAEAEQEISDLVEFMNSSAELSAAELAKESEKQLEELNGQMEDLEAQRMAAASATGTAQTSFGAFRFQSYTDDEKKAVDANILAEIVQINRKASDISRGGPM